MGEKFPFSLKKILHLYDNKKNSIEIIKKKRKIVE